MNLLSKLVAQRSRPKAAFVQPPFWATDQLLFSNLLGDKEKIPVDFPGVVEQIYKQNGVVFACAAVRMLIFSEARFQWRRFEGGRPTELFGDTALELLERPWKTGTTGELLARMEQDVTLAGNFYATIVGTGRERRIRRLRPDWVTIVVGSPSDDPNDIDADVLGYIYDPPGSKVKPEVIAPEEMCHYSPYPDPVAQFRGMSWLTPVMREVQSDKAATEHKLNFFKHGATPNMVVTYDKAVGKEAFDEFVKKFTEKHEGAQNAYKTLHLGGGSAVTVVGKDFQQLDFKQTVGVSETRVCAAAGVHPVVVGLSEGLQGSSLNAGNFQSARRRMADGTMRPLWRIASSSLETLVSPPPNGAHLWYDARDVAFLRQDAKEEADILATQAGAVARLLDAGYDPDKAVQAVVTGDLRQLTGTHSGLFSVQLQPPGSNQENSNEDEEEV